jgi:hypothetical protein
MKAIVTNGWTIIKIMATMNLSCTHDLLFIHHHLSDFPCSSLAKDARGIFPFLVMFLLSIARAPFLFFFVYLSVLLVPPQVSEFSHYTAEYFPAGIRIVTALNFAVWVSSLSS